MTNRAVSLSIIRGTRRTDAFATPLAGVVSDHWKPFLASRGLSPRKTWYGLGFLVVGGSFHALMGVSVSPTSGLPACTATVSLMPSTRHCFHADGVAAFEGRSSGGLLCVVRRCLQPWMG